MGVIKCKDSGIDHGINVLSEFPVLRDILIRVVRTPLKSVKVESRHEFIVRPYKFQLRASTKNNSAGFPVEFSLRCSRFSCEPLPPFSFKYCLKLHKLGVGKSEYWSGVWNYPSHKVLILEKVWVYFDFNVCAFDFEPYINAENCIMVSLELN